MPTKKNTDATLDACMAATTPAQFARALNKDGRSVRNVLRSKFGTYVSRGGVFDDATKRALYAYIVEGDKSAPEALLKANASQ